MILSVFCFVCWVFPLSANKRQKNGRIKYYLLRRDDVAVGDVVTEWAVVGHPGRHPSPRAPSFAACEARPMSAGQERHRRLHLTPAEWAELNDSNFVFVFLLLLSAVSGWFSVGGVRSRRRCRHFLVPSRQISMQMSGSRNAQFRLLCFYFVGYLGMYLVH